MRKKDYDVLKPDGYEMTFADETHSVEALPIDVVIEALPSLNAFRAAAEKVDEKTGEGAEELVACAKNLVQVVAPELASWPSRMTFPQLSDFISDLSELIAANPPTKSDESEAPEAE